MYGAQVHDGKNIIAYIVYTVPVPGKRSWQIWSGLYNITIEILRALIIKLTQARARTSFEAYSYVFALQTTGLWKTACDSLAQTRERRRYTDIPLDIL